MGRVWKIYKGWVISFLFRPARDFSIKGLLLCLSGRRRALILCTFWFLLLSAGLVCIALFHVAFLKRENEINVFFCSSFLQMVFSGFLPSFA